MEADFRCHGSYTLCSFCLFVCLFVCLSVGGLSFSGMTQK